MSRNIENSAPVNGAPVTAPVNPAMADALHQADAQAERPIGSIERESLETEALIARLEKPTSFLSPGAVGRLLDESEQVGDVHQQSAKKAPTLYSIESKFRADAGRITRLTLDMDLDADVQMDGLTAKLDKRTRQCVGGTIKLLPRKGEVFTSVCQTSVGEVRPFQWRLKSVELECVVAQDDNKRFLIDPRYVLLLHTSREVSGNGKLSEACARLMGLTPAARGR